MQAPFFQQIALLDRLGFSGMMQLVYTDPPFYSGKVQKADAGAFVDRWPTLTAYLEFIRTYMVSILPLLAPTGFFVLHCDYHASHYIKVIGDEVFGYENFRNEIVWHYTGRRTPAGLRVNSKHDVLLIWARSGAARMQPLSDPWGREHYIRMKKQQVHVDENGREWIWGHKGRGQSHAYRIYIDEAVRQGRYIDSVWDMPIIAISSKERTGYPTQKPVQLLDRVVELLTTPGQWVGDFMAGSGTTGVAAVSRGRPVVLGDSNPDAVAIIRRRMAQITR
ncbi:MAG: site-specific DNA-methyltransferase [Sulfobacillus thermotolerans]|uniref:Site-specific DNA-methyltransferase n=2 Tax=Clostridiales Family XVII. Incertae Sedis TaxID=539000 RepID=A0ABM6RNK9_9FIRM|nr:site-specific DNA-methyltransferase [Sulfobacillus thermotolerans]MCY0907169.1 site-specific DNA-methyltransferase [Sulfobacillus thermotolerans]POB11227.1 site-specific DNA-methyltransferase [Sulfobacillus sp. hq2]